MAAVCVCRNHDRSSEILLFYCSEGQNVGLRTENDLDDEGSGESRGPGDGRAAPPAPTLPIKAGPNKVDALVAQPGSFVSMYFDKMMRVYGIRANGYISQLSPGVQAIKKSPKTPRPALGGCGNGDDQAWLYYLDDHDPPQLTQFVLAGAAVRPFSEDSARPSPQTSLAAYYKAKDKSRACVYQTKSGTLRYLAFSSNGQQNSGDVVGTSSAVDKTPIATVVIDDYVFVYYIDGSQVLNRIVRKGNDGQWSNTSLAQDTLWGSTPLAAVASLDGSKIRIYQAIEGENDTGTLSTWDDDVSQYSPSQ